MINTRNYQAILHDHAETTSVTELADNLKHLLDAGWQVQMDEIGYILRPASYAIEKSSIRAGMDTFLSSASSPQEILEIVKIRFARYQSLQKISSQLPGY